MLCFGKFPVANKFTDEKGGKGLFPRNFLSQSAEKIRTDLLVCH